MTKQYGQRILYYLSVFISCGYGYLFYSLDYNFIHFSLFNKLWCFLPPETQLAPQLSFILVSNTEIFYIWFLYVFLAFLKNISSYIFEYHPIFCHYQKLYSFLSCLFSILAFGKLHILAKRPGIFH